MQQPCCVGVIRCESDLKGSLSKINGDALELYTTEPGENRNGAAVVVIHDIYGFGIPNSKYVVDHLASHGFVSVMGDLYHGDAWPASSTPPHQDEKFGPWAQTKTSPEFWGQVTSELAAIAEHLRSKGISKIGLLGFCWGGRAAANAACSGHFQAAISAHGAGHGASEVKSSKCPLFYIVPEGDLQRSFPLEKVEEIRKAFDDKEGVEGDIKVYNGVEHGWMVRGNFEDEHIKKTADEAVADAVGFFQKHLL